MVTTVKFSQFSQGAVNDSTLQTVGLSGGVNSRQSRQITWTTGTRPAIPYVGLLGFNSTIDQYEFWNGISWIPLASGGGSGTVTSIATGTGLTGGPINTSGTISFAPIAANSLWANTSNSTAVPMVVPTSTFLQSSNNLSDVPNKATARTNLGLAIGTNVEAWNALLDQIAAGTWPGAASISTVGTITSGVWQGSTIGVLNGGTGATGFTPYGVVCGGTTATGALQSVTALGPIGYVLTSNGPGTLPTFQSVSGSGTVNSGLINQLAFYAAGGTAVSGLATGNSGVLVTDNTGVPSISTTLPSGLSATNLALTTPILGTPQSGDLSNCTGYTVANLSDVPWTDFSSSIGYTGFSGTPTTTLARGKQVGKIFFYEIIMSGTSNANTFTITGMPVAAARSNMLSAVMQALDNSNSFYSCQARTTASSTTLTMLHSNNANGWTASGTKSITFQGFYEAA